MSYPTLDPRELVHVFLATCSNKRRCHLCLRDIGHMYHQSEEHVARVREELTLEREREVGAIVGAALAALQIDLTRLSDSRPLHRRRFRYQL